MGGATILHVASARMKTAIYQYFLRDSATAKPSSLTAKEKEVMEKFVNKAEKRRCCHCGSYNEYATEERASIGKYAAENGATKACRHFSSTAGRQIPESTVKNLRSEYLLLVRCWHGHICIPGNYNHTNKICKQKIAQFGSKIAQYNYHKHYPLYGMS